MDSGIRYARNGGIAIAYRVVGAGETGQAQAGEVLVTGTVRDLAAGSGFDFEDRGHRELKGVPGSWHLYAASQEAPR